jgi:hypothetical protein
MYFCKDFAQEAASRSEAHYSKFKYRSIEEYLSLFSEVQKQRIRGESTTHYLYSKVAAEEIAKFNSDSRIVMLLRDPITFLHSYHTQWIAEGQENEASFEKALELEPERKQGRYIPPNTYAPSFLYYSERVKYYKQMKRFFDVFGHDRIKVFLFEDFKKDNLRVVREIFDFLKVDINFQPELLHINPTKIPRHHVINQIVRNPAMEYFFEKSFLKIIVGNTKVKDFLKACLWKKQSKPALSEDLCRTLQQRFRPEVERTSEFLGIDLIQRWGFDR